MLKMNPNAEATKTSRLNLYPHTVSSKKALETFFSFSCVIKPITDFELPPKLSLYLKFPGGKLEKGGWLHCIVLQSITFIK